MKILQYYGTFNLETLRQQLFERFPEWRVVSNESITEYLGISYNSNTYILTLYVPDNADELEVKIIIDNHDPQAISAPSTDWAGILQARRDFLNLPNWSTWTVQQTIDFIHNDILSGMDKTQLESWVNTNVTSLATAKTALILIGQELIDLREICEKLAQMLIYLRKIVIERKN